MNRAAFLDRDGVINRVVLRNGRPYSPASVGELEVLPRVYEAIETLRRNAYLVIVVTNQPDIARGIQSREEVEAMHAKLARDLPIDDIRVCYHVDEDACPCRKPKPGMLLQAAFDWSVDLKRSFMVGDRWRDVEAGKAAGCKTILVGNGYAERKAQNPDAVVSSLCDASALILSESFGGS